MTEIKRPAKGESEDSDQWFTSESDRTTAFRRCIFLDSQLDHIRTVQEEEASK